MKVQSKAELSLVHICNGFFDSHLYRSLFSGLHRRGVHQQVFVFGRKRKAKDDYSFPYVLHNVREKKIYHRALFTMKVNSAYSRLRQCVDLSVTDVVHAHTFFSDGAIALKAKNEFGTPYVVSVRNTDLNIFLAYRPDLFPLGREIYLNASRVIFLNASYRQRFVALLFKGNAEKPSKILTSIIPNGVSERWLTNKPDLRNRLGNVTYSDFSLSGSLRDPDTTVPLRCLTIGNGSRNKNFACVIRAVNHLGSSRPVTLDLVGRLDRFDLLTRVLIWLHPFVRYHGQVNLFSEMISIYRNCDVFVLPSKRETFGIVYLEALSQGLPIVWRAGEGVDGYFEPGTVGSSISELNYKNLASEISLVGQKHLDVRKLCVSEAARFSWSNIANTYYELYAAIQSPEHSRLTNVW